MDVERHDLIIVGAGPAGLTAAINAESERIDSLVLDCNTHLGGQAGTSSRIENYPGFPDGLSGDQLAANFVDQALRFNTEFLTERVNGVESTEDGILIHTDEADSFIGLGALVSTGVEYRKLRVRNLAAYLGRGATYGSPLNSQVYKDKKLFVVGGANSAGQAAIHLSDFESCEVHLLVRGSSIEDKMSAYLSDRIIDRKNIIVHTGTEVVSVDGNGRLNKVSLRTDGEVYDTTADELFIMIGSDPKTLWLPDTIGRDKAGFVITGSDMSSEERDKFAESNGGRQPFAHESAMPGLFVAGDLRCGTNKKVASAVGDAANVVPEFHRYRSLQKKTA